MPLALLRNKHAYAAKQKLVILHMPVTSRAGSSLMGGQRGDFDAFVHYGDSFGGDSASDQALCNILAVGHKPFDRRVARTRNPTTSQWEANPARQKKRQLLVGAGQPSRRQSVGLVQVRKVEAVVREQSAYLRGCSSAQTQLPYFVNGNSRFQAACRQRRIARGHQL